VRRVESGILLEPVVTYIDAWFVELDLLFRRAAEEETRGHPSVTAIVYRVAQEPATRREEPAKPFGFAAFAARRFRTPHCQSGPCPKPILPLAVADRPIERGDEVKRRISCTLGRDCPAAGNIGEPPCTAAS
jgi:hypothetical protein